jgi:hypothetical protein
MASCIIWLYHVSICRYTTVGRDILPQIKTGDVILSAKLVEGQDRLILPNESWSTLLPSRSLFILCVCCILMASAWFYCCRLACQVSHCQFFFVVLLSIWSSVVKGNFSKKKKYLKFSCLSRVKFITFSQRRRLFNWSLYFRACKVTCLTSTESINLAFIYFFLFIFFIKGNVITKPWKLDVTKHWCWFLCTLIVGWKMPKI